MTKKVKEIFLLSVEEVFALLGQAPKQLLKTGYTRQELIKRLGELDTELYAADQEPNNPVRRKIEDLFHYLLAKGSPTDKIAVAEVHPD